MRGMQERGANAEEVVGVLPCERYAWAHASVYGNIGLARPTQREIHEKRQMCGRDSVEQTRVLWITEMRMITQQGGSPAASKKRLTLPITGPLVGPTRLEIGEEVVFMIAHEKHIGRIGLLQMEQQVEHTLTVWPAVNIIAEKDQAIGRRVVAQDFEEAHDLIEAAVNIANGIIHAPSFPVTAPLRRHD